MNDIAPPDTAGAETQIPVWPSAHDAAVAAKTLRTTAARIGGSSASAAWLEDEARKHEQSIRPLPFEFEGVTADLYAEAELFEHIAQAWVGAENADIAMRVDKELADRLGNLTRALTDLGYRKQETP